MQIMQISGHKATRYSSDSLFCELSHLTFFSKVLASEEKGLNNSILLNLITAYSCSISITIFINLFYRIVLMSFNNFMIANGWHKFLSPQNDSYFVVFYTCVKISLTFMFSIRYFSRMTIRLKFS